MSKSKISSGVNVPIVVFIVLLILKLEGLINHSWWWVTSPLWIGLVIFALIALVALPFLIIDRYKNRKRW